MFQNPLKPPFRLQAVSYWFFFLDFQLDCQVQLNGLALSRDIQTKLTFVKILKKIHVAESFVKANRL